MLPSSFFDTLDSSFRRDGFSEFGGDFPDLNSTFTASPDQLSQPLPDTDPSVSWLPTLAQRHGRLPPPQPSSSAYPPALDNHHPANFAATSPHSNAHPPFDFLDRPLQTDLSVQYHTPVFNPQDFGPTPTPHQPPATLNAGRSWMHNGSLRGRSSIVVNGSSPVSDAFYSPPDPFSPARTVQFHHNGSPMFVDQTSPFNSNMGTTYRQIQPAPAGLTGRSSSINSDLALQPMVPRFFPQKMPRRNPREDRSVTCSPYHPIRTLSSPVQAVSPKETSLHTCQWTGNDDNICGAQITYASVPGHLTAHGVERMTHNHRLPCRWLGCRLRRDKDMMNRESIVRHVREKHMGYRRTL